MEITYVNQKEFTWDIYSPSLLQPLVYKLIPVYTSKPPIVTDTCTAQEAVADKIHLLFPQRHDAGEYCHNLLSKIENILII